MAWARAALTSGVSPDWQRGSRSQPTERRYSSAWGESKRAATWTGELPLFIFPSSTSIGGGGGLIASSSSAAARSSAARAVASAPVATSRASMTSRSTSAMRFSRDSFLANASGA